MNQNQKKPSTPLSSERAQALQEIANRIRIDCIRMLAEAGSGHPGGSLSVADIVSVLMFEVMRHDPRNPRWDKRDRFIMSKGHCVPAWYSALAEAGYFPKSDLMTLRKLGSRLQGHPDCNTLDAIEACTGSLGQGLSIAVGMALAGKLNKAPWRVFVVLGDGESQEGQVWEAAMSAPKFRLDNLVAILDHNQAQIDGYTYEVMPLEPMDEKLRAFGWNVLRINGHDILQVHGALLEAQTTREKPTFIIADTIKGKGVSFMENVVDWHGKAPSPEEARKAIEELERIGA